MNSYPLGLWLHPTGAVIRVSHGWYQHVGLLSDRAIDGERCVLAFSAEAGGLIELPFSEFAKGREVAVDGYLGSLPPAFVMARARSLQGRPYSWLTFNCEHFVCYAHGVDSQSPQLRQWLFGGSLLGLLALASR